MVELYGEILPEPKLRFDYSSEAAEDTFSKRGLERYGPYDSILLGKDKIKCIVLFPNHLSKEKKNLIDGLIKGEGTFKGFKNLFKIPLEFFEEVPFSSDTEIDILLDHIISKNPDLVYILLNSCLLYTSPSPRDS